VNIEVLTDRLEKSDLVRQVQTHAHFHTALTGSQASFHIEASPCRDTYCHIMPYQRSTLGTSLELALSPLEVHDRTAHVCHAFVIVLGKLMPDT
jgi:hypothetical protein